MTFAGDCERPSWKHYRYILDRDGLSPDAISTSTLSSLSFRHIRQAPPLSGLAWFLHRRHSALLPLPEFQSAFSRSLDSRDWRRGNSRIGIGNSDRHHPTSSKTHLLGCHSNVLGFRLRFWARHRRFVRRIYNLALDILYQFSLLRDRFLNRTLGHETPRRKRSVQETTPSCRLDRRIPFRLQHLQLLDWCDMGRFRISMVELAYTGPNHTWICRRDCNDRLGALRGFQAFPSS